MMMGWEREKAETCKVVQPQVEKLFLDWSHQTRMFSERVVEQEMQIFSFLSLFTYEIEFFFFFLFLRRPAGKKEGKEKEERKGIKKLVLPSVISSTTVFSPKHWLNFHGNAPTSSVGSTSASSILVSGSIL